MRDSLLGRQPQPFTCRRPGRCGGNGAERRALPDLRAEAVKLVLEQAEALCAEWAA